MTKSGHTVESMAELSGVPRATVQDWLSGKSELSPADHEALQRARNGFEPRRQTPRSDLPKVGSAAEMQALAREATAECFDLWRAVVNDSASPMAARLRASESLMQYGWGVPPKLQAERKVEAPAKDNELIEKFGRLAGNDAKSS